MTITLGRKRGRTAMSVTALLVAGALITAGCGAQKVGEAGSSGANGGAKAKFNSMLPEQIRAAGVLKLGTDASAPPFAFIGSDNRTVEGVNVDLANAVGPLLGVRIDLRNVAFDQSIPSVTSHRVDLYWDWTKDRAQSRLKVDFVDFAITGAGILVAQGNPANIRVPADLCGKTVSVQDGSSNVDIVETLSEQQCAGSGKPAIEVLKFDTVPSALLQIKGGRAVATVASYGVASYEGRTSPDYDATGDIISPIKAGFTMAKGQPALRDAVRAALQELIATGQYGEIMNKWSLNGSKIDSITVNDGNA
ncbi:ABC transporter substrate-binding protein [Nocardia sp. CA2R105]|uniref:ABC transporter substrate-binding protein n=1 Tax=Nocardia coffeae TaxID=2873381 RepID=UPI001CA62FDA|nr:ABC transporter substrate-binding protein [Nocardia coffeae]MBY8863789.1 ABC transporter substrate-binding protein [Nocardia coffeae]